MNGLCVQNKDEITFNKNSFNEMKKKRYVVPTSKVISLMDEIMITKSSVFIKNGSTEEDWGADEEVPGEEEEV